MSEEQNVADRPYYLTVYEQLKEAYRYANKLHLIDFATKRLGWQVDTAQEDDRGVVLNHEEHDTIIVSPRPDAESGDWEFVWAEGTYKGRMTHLLRMADWEVPEIIGLKDSPGIEQFTRLPDKTYEAPREQDPEKQTELAEQRFSEIRLDTETSCLEYRGIKEEIYAEFPQMKVNGEGATFKLYNIVEGHMRACSTVEYVFDNEGKSNYFFQKGLPKGLAVLREAGPVERIVVSTSPISALSFKQLEEEMGGQSPKTMYVSTCGELTEGIVDSLTHLFKQAKEQNQLIVIARDNYFHSIRRADVVMSFAQQQELNVRVSVPPTGEDWNDYLGELHYYTEYPDEADFDKQASLEAQQYEFDLIDNPDYKNTLLEQLDVPEKTCEDMSGYIASEKSIHFPLSSDPQDICHYKPAGTYSISLTKDKRFVGHCEHKGTAPGLWVLPLEERYKGVVFNGDSWESPLEGRSKAIVVTADPLNVFKHRTEQQAKFKDNADSAPITTYVSTCHQDAREIKRLLKAFLENRKHSHITLYMDPEAAEKLKSQLGNEIRIDGQLQPLKYDTYTPSKAAWEIDNRPDAKEGEAAVLAPQEEVQKEVIQPTDPQSSTVSEEATRTASKELEPIHISQASLNKTPAYERTLLEQLEIPQKACQSIKGYEADEKQITFPIYADSKAVKEQKPMGSYQFKLEEKGLVDYTAARDKTPGLVVLPAQKAPNSVVITSSPLDIFLHRAEQQSQTSIWQQWANPPATTYICTCGKAGKDLQKPLEDILSQHKDTNLVFYMNNNEARDLRIHLDKSVLSDQNKGFAYKVSPPRQSLWHDVSDKESQDTPKVVQEELWEQITPRQSQDKGIKIQ